MLNGGGGGWVLVDGLMNERGNKSINIINEAKCQEQNIVIVLYGDRDQCKGISTPLTYNHVSVGGIYVFMILSPYKFLWGSLLLQSSSQTKLGKAGRQTFKDERLGR